MQLKIVDVIDRAPNVKSIRFERPAMFSFKPGQFLLLALDINESKEKRAYSIASSPTEKEYLEITFKKVEGGTFSPVLYEQKEGNTLDVKGPFGLFTLDKHHMNNLVLIAGGTGITPIRSIIKYIIDTDAEKQITLIYGARTPPELIYEKELQEIHQQHPNIGIYFTVNEDPANAWSWHKGNIEQAFIKECVHDLQGATYYIVGPPKMITNVMHDLETLGVNPSQIHTERW